MITLLNEDNMQVMARYPDKYFDLAIVDPPYGIKAGNGTGRSIRVAIEKGKIKGGDWDNEIPSEEYFNELFRVSKYQIIWGGNYFPLPTSKSFAVWDKGETMYNRDFAECEFAWVTPDKPAKIFKKNPTQLDRIHPTQKPVQLYRWLLDKYAKQGDKILDTHLGSGSIAIACHDMGFDLVATEIDKDYYEAACKRFNEQTKQQKLFAA
jgi:site-specific DNA-methyltransferase (adenine-specific)